MKKNTLLYLDSDLVERAKRENINISRLVEDTLRQALNISTPRTAREHIRRVLADAGRENAFYGEAYLLPFQIKSLKLENVGPFEEFEAEFSKDAINVIFGLGGSGKSFIIRSILLAFGRHHRYFQTSDSGKVALKLFPDQASVSVTTSADNQSDITRGYKCLLVDGVFQRAPRNMTHALYEEMKNLRIQIIATASTPIDPSKLLKDTHVITLKSATV
jgi:post-segregation antitoxin (ccd killing protein)